MSANRPMPPWFRPMVERLIAEALEDALDGYTPPLLVEIEVEVPRVDAR